MARAAVRAYGPAESLSSQFLSMTAFAPDLLEDREGFAARLQALLERARVELDAAWIAVAESSSPDGALALRWRAGVGHDDIEVDRDRIACWSAPGRTSPPWAIALAVEPAIDARPDAALAFHCERAPEPELLSSLCIALTRGLSANREAQLARLALAAMRASADPIEISDRQARLAWVNDAWRRIYGYRDDEAVGRTVAELLRDPETPRHDPAFYQFSMQVITTGHDWLGMLVSRAKGGQQVYAETAVAPFDAGAQGFLGNIAIRRNLAHRIEREEALARAHQEFRAVLAALPDAVVVLRSRRIYFANAAFLRVVDQPEAAVIGRPPAAFVHPDDHHLLLPDAVPPTRMRMVRRDGTTRLLDVSTAGSVSFEGAPAMIVIGRDLTEVRVAEEQLSRAERLWALGSLAAGVAHEINNPLSYVILNLELLADELRGGPLQEPVTESLEGAHRILRIADELRGFSRGDRGEGDVVEVERAVTAAINITQNLIRHRATLIRELTPGLHARIPEGPLVQALVNLLTNAAHALPEQRRDHRITVRSRVGEHDDIELEVQDTGTGITPELLSRMFDPFFTTKPAGKGSGLGLAITRRIVEQVGGRIEVSTEVGAGTCVRLRLPASEEAEHVAGGTPPQPLGPGQHLRLLVIDDDVGVARALGRLLRQHQVDFEHDPARARDRLLAGEQFDAVLCDVMMPGLDGPSLYEAVAAAEPALARRIIFMTGGAFTDEAAAFLARVGPVLMKPFVRAEVHARIEAIVRAAAAP